MLIFLSSLVVNLERVIFIHFLELYSHMQQYIYMCIQNHNDDTIKTSDTVLRKIYLSLYLKEFEKGYSRFYCERELETEQNCNILTPTLMAISVVFFLFSRAAQPEAHFAGCKLPLPHLVTNGSGLQTNWLPVFRELYNSSIAHSISLEWHVWSSSSGNNCHAVHRSLSSGASVYDCTMGFYLVPYCQPSPPTQFLLITAIGMSHFRRLWHGMFGRVEGQYTTIIWSEEVLLIF